MRDDVALCATSSPSPNHWVHKMQPQASGAKL